MPASSPLSWSCSASIPHVNNIYVPWEWVSASISTFSQPSRLNEGRFKFHHVSCTTLYSLFMYWDKIVFLLLLLLLLQTSAAENFRVSLSAVVMHSTYEYIRELVAHVIYLIWITVCRGHLSLPINAGECVSQCYKFMHIQDSLSLILMWKSSYSVAYRVLSVPHGRGRNFNFPLGSLRAYINLQMSNFRQVQSNRGIIMRVFKALKWIERAPKKKGEWNGSTFFFSRVRVLFFMDHGARNI